MEEIAMDYIRAPSRLHISLIDMEGSLGRVDGSMGVALEEPCFEIGFEKAQGVLGVEGETKRFVEGLCKKLGAKGIRIDLKKMIPAHVGFGSKTQLSLAIASGICRTYGIKRNIRELAGLVGRGGTSGIGVAAFEQGGFILDGGHDAGKGFVPSRYSNAAPAPVLARYEFPWRLVCAWPKGQGAHGGAEKSIFEKNCPILPKEVGEVSRIVLMKMLPSVVEQRIDKFGESLNLVQKTGFKKIEVGLQTPQVRKLLALMQKSSAGAGMSSFGPVCFSPCETESEAIDLARLIKKKFDANVIMTRANNTGARWL